MALEGPPFFLPASLSCQQQQHPSPSAWSCVREGSCSMRYLVQVSWYVSLLIIDTFKYMHLVPLISNDCLDITFAHLTMFGGDWQGACVYRFWFATRGISEKPSFAPIIAPLLHLVSCSPIPFPLSRHWVDLFQDCTLPRGKKGLKAQKVKAAGKR